MQNEEIELLIKEVREGHIDQFERIIDHFQPQIFRYCYHMLRHRQEAEDALQEVFLKAYEHLGQYHQ